MAFNYRQGNWIAFDPNTKEIMTSKENLNNLVKQFYKFEACVSQSAVVEFVLFTILAIYGYEETRKLADIKIEDLVKFTLGQMIKILTKNNLLEDKIRIKLTNYCNRRNNLIHHTIGESATTDFDEFLNDGEEIIVELNTIFQKFLNKKGINHNW